MSYALITGASGGIGCELALQFARDGHNLVLVTRQVKKLEKLSRDLWGVSGMKPDLGRYFCR